MYREKHNYTGGKSTIGATDLELIREKEQGDIK